MVYNCEKMKENCSNSSSCGNAMEPGDIKSSSWYTILRKTQNNIFQECPNLAMETRSNGKEAMSSHQIENQVLEQGNVPPNKSLAVSAFLARSNARAENCGRMHRHIYVAELVGHKISAKRVKRERLNRCEIPPTRQQGG